MDRTYVVTGAASGIGAATARYLRERGGRVIACDLHNADVIANLATIEGRAELVAGVTRLSRGSIDAIVANAGGGAPETMLSLNFFGSVATLEGLRPLMKTSPAPRAVMVSSIASVTRSIRESSKRVYAWTNPRQSPPGRRRSRRTRGLWICTATPSMRSTAGAEESRASRNGPAPEFR